MCLAIPGQVESLYEENGLIMARVNFGGIKKAVCLEYTPTAVKGDYVLVHVGFSISIIDEEEATRTYNVLDLAGELEELETPEVRL